MTDQPKETGKTSTASDTKAPAGEKPARGKRWIKWRHRLKWIAIVFVALAILFRVLLSILLPVVVNKAAGYYGLDCSYDRISLGVLTGEASIWGLKLTPAGGGEPIAQLDYIRGDISVFRLFTGRLVVWRAEADGVDLVAHRTAQGDSPLVKLLLTQSVAKANSASVPASTGTETFDLEAPLTVEAFRLSHVRAHIIDQMVQPNVDATLAMDLRVSDIGRPGLPVRFEMDFWADPVLDLMRVSGTADLKGDAMSAQMEITARGLRLQPVEGYLANFGISPAANEITAHMSGKLTAKATSADASALDVKLQLSGLSLRADGQEAAAIDSLILSINPFSYDSATFAGASIDGVRMHAIRTVDGRFRVGGIELGAAPNASLDHHAPEMLTPSLAANRVNRQFSASPQKRSSPAVAESVEPASDLMLNQLALSQAVSSQTVQASPANFHLTQLPGDWSILLPSLVTQIQSDAAPATQPTIPATQPASTQPVATQPGADSASTQPAIPTTQGAADLPTGSISITHVALQFDDYAISPAVSLQMLMPKLILRAGPNPQKHFTANSYTLDGQFTLPGILRQMRIDGVIKPDANGLLASIDLQGAGFQPDRLAPYLAQLQMESILSDARLTGHLKLAIPSDPARGLDLNFSNLSLADQQQWFLMKTIAISGLRITPQAIAIKSLEIDGPEVHGIVLPDQRVELLGFRTILAGMSAGSDTTPATAEGQPKPAAKTSASRPAPAATEQAAEVNLPSVRLDHFLWKGVRLQMEDQSTATPTSLLLQDASLEMNNLLWDPSGKQVSPQGELNAHLSAPAIADKLALNGTFTPTRRGLTLDLVLSGDGLTARELTQYLAPFGITPTLTKGTLAGKIHAEIGLENTHFVGSMKLENFRYADGNTELAAIDELDVQLLGLAMDGHAHLGRVFVNRPRITLGRNPAGAFTILGMAIAKPKASDANGSLAASAVPAASTVQSANASSTKSPATQPALSSLASQPSMASQPAATQPADAPLVMDKLEILESAITWNDLAIAPAFQTALRSNILLTNFSLAPGAPEAELTIRFSADGLIEPGDFNGKVAISAQSQKLNLTLATGLIDARQLSRYLQPMAEFTLQQGHINSHLEIASASILTGGRSLLMQVRDVSLTEQSVPDPLLKLDQFTIRAAQLDPSAGKYAFKEISLVGPGLQILQDDHGLNALGICLLPPDESTSAKPAPSTQPATVSVAASSPATQPVASTSGKPAAAVESEEVTLRRALQQAQQNLPLLTIDYLWMEKGQVRYRDVRKGREMSFTLGDLGLMNDKWVEIGGPRAAMRSPIEITFWADLAPVIRKIVVMAQISPLSFQPAGRVDLWVSGISGNGLTQAVPSLKSMIDGSTLTDGELEAHVSAQAKTLRRAGLPDFASPFDADFLARQIAYRAQPKGPALAGIGEIRGEGAHIIPATGSIHLKSLEITSIMGRASRDSAGLHVLGLTIPLGTSAATQPAEGSVAASQPAEKSSAVAAVTAKPASAKSASTTSAKGPSEPLPAELGIDKLTISGIDLLYEDTSVRPALVVPINQLDAEIRGLSNHALFRPNMPINFSAFMGAGKSSPTAPREVFSQISTSGQITLYPNPSGWAKTSIDAFDLGSLSGVAKENGVALNNGYVDVSVDSRFQPNGDMSNRVKVVISDLDLSEPDDGPIRRTLRLGAPLNAVIAGLEDASGGITVPLNVPIQQGELNTAKVIHSAQAAIAPILATAAISGPIKLVNAFIGKSSQVGNLTAAIVEYPEGSAVLDAAGQAQLDQVIERLKKDKRLQVTLTQQIGAADLSLAWQRANPTRDQVRQIASQLRTQKFALLTRRSDLEGQIRAQLAYQPDAATPLLNELRQLNRDLAATEAALDRTYELVRPGADSQALQRARKTAIEIAQQRLDEIKARLLASGVSEIDQRVRVQSLRFQPPQDNQAPGQVIVTFLDRGK